MCYWLDPGLSTAAKVGIGVAAGAAAVVGGAAAGIVAPSTVGAAVATAVTVVSKALAKWAGRQLPTETSH